MALLLVRYLLLAVALPPLLALPGWAWLRRAGVDPVLAAYVGPAATLAAMAAVVGVAVLLPWRVSVTCMVALGLMALSAAWCAATAPRPRLPPRADLAGLAVWAVAYLALAAFSGVPSRPVASWKPQTTGPGRVDTPRWPGMTRDNTYPFRTGQIALHKLGGRNLRQDFALHWWISDRTPLSGLTFAFTAGALGVDVPAENLWHVPARAAPMRTTDRYGFWAYQLTAMAINLTILLGIFLLARLWRGRRVALVATLAAALMPGLVLSGIYTWPKQAIGYFVLAAVACAWRGRPALAGGLAALGYLVHPAGIWWVPSIALVLLAAPGARGRARGLLARFAAAGAVLVGPWVAFTAGVMHATSRLVTWPLGWNMQDPTEPRSQLALAWRHWIRLQPVEPLWVRVQSTAGSLFPLDLGRDLTPGLRGRDAADQAGLLWVNAHGLSIWGIVGIVLFPVLVVSIVRRWPRDRGWLLRVAAPALVLAELANGFAYPLATQSMFPLVGLLAIAAGAALLEASPRLRAVVLTAMALELGTVLYGVLYAPFAIGAGQQALLTVIAACGHVALLAVLAQVLRGAPLAGLRVRRAVGR